MADAGPKIVARRRCECAYEYSPIVARTSCNAILLVAEPRLRTMQEPFERHDGAKSIHVPNVIDDRRIVRPVCLSRSLRYSSL